MDYGLSHGHHGTKPCRSDHGEAARPMRPAVEHVLSFWSTQLAPFAPLVTAPMDRPAPRGRWCESNASFAQTYDVWALQGIQCIISKPISSRQPSFPHEFISGDRSHPWPAYGPSTVVRRSRGASVANDVLHGFTRSLGYHMEPAASL